MDCVATTAKKKTNHIASLFVQEDNASVESVAATPIKVVQQEEAAADTGQKASGLRKNYRHDQKTTATKKK